MKIGIGQINPTVGDLPGNLEIIQNAYVDLVKRGADLVVFPELAVVGTLLAICFSKRTLELDASKHSQIALTTQSNPILIGFPESVPNANGKPFYNSAALCKEGEIIQIFRKRLLPTYDVFDEDRYFESGQSEISFTHRGIKIGVSICEDLWNVDGSKYQPNPVASLAEEKLDLLVNLSASPWHTEKRVLRAAILKKVVQAVKCPLIYVNATGGNDELIFDGSSLALDKHGKETHISKSFAENYEIFDLKSPVPSPRLQKTRWNQSVWLLFSAYAIMHTRAVFPKH